MKIIKQGNPEKNDPPKQKTCHNCDAVLEYTRQDIHHDFRDGDYIKCLCCGAFLSV